jgi:hypothetical protein
VAIGGGMSRGKVALISGVSLFSPVDEKVAIRLLRHFGTFAQQHRFSKFFLYLKMYTTGSKSSSWLGL